MIFDSLIKKNTELFRENQVDVCLLEFFPETKTTKMLQAFYVETQILPRIGETMHIPIRDSVCSVNKYKVIDVRWAPRCKHVDLVLEKI